MNRLFEEHTVRRILPLDGSWRMSPDRENRAEAENWKNGLPAGARRVIVPQCWNLEMDLFEFEGACWYEKEFSSEKGRVLIEMEGVLGLADVYLDGKHLRSHYGGYTAFTAEAEVEAGRHRLVVKCDNTKDEDSIPARHVDWFNYGGIHRSVNVHMLPEAWIAACRYEYELTDDLKNASVHARLTVRSETDREIKVSVSLDGETVLTETVGLHKGENEIALSAFDVKSVRLWDEGKGNLYTVRAMIDEDDMIDRIGFRKIEAKDGRIYLNGKSIFLRGVNRHEEHPDWGFAVPAQINERDLQILKKMNINAVRGSHYPASKQFLDMLDEEGILFWSEIPMWGFPKELMARPLVIERGLAMHAEMTEQYFNHPSIVIWGAHNECETFTDEGYEITRQFTGLLREKGGNRLVTYATMYFEKDICFGLADFVSVNKYHGWYGESIKEWKTYIPSLRERLIETGNADKPVVMSEFGAAAVYGYKSFDENKWTEEYQTEVLTEVIRLSANEPGCAGTYVWQFADMRSDMNINRARSFNNKGVVNEHRRPKMAFYAVKSLYEAISKE